MRKKVKYVIQGYVYCKWRVITIIILPEVDSYVRLVVPDQLTVVHFTCGLPVRIRQTRWAVRADIHSITPCADLWLYRFSLDLLIQIARVQCKYNPQLTGFRRFHSNARLLPSYVMLCVLCLDYEFFRQIFITP